MLSEYFFKKHRKFTGLLCKDFVRLFGAGQDVSNHAKFTYPENHVLPNIQEKDGVDALINLCVKFEID
jgi:hypothetical protein